MASVTNELLTVIPEKYCLITGTRQQTQLCFLCKTQPFLHAFQVRTKELMLSPYYRTFVTTEMFFYYSKQLCSMCRI